MRAVSGQLPVLIFGVSLMTAACESQAVYEGARRPKSELAHVVGDTRLSSGLPVAIILRSVDDEELGLRYRGAWLLPGEHDLLIDCTVTESKRTSRHHLHVELDAGVKYKLVASTRPGNQECADVQLTGSY